VIAFGVIAALIPSGEQLGTIGQRLLYAERPVVQVMLDQVSIADHTIHRGIPILAIGADETEIPGTMDQVGIDVLAETQVIGTPAAEHRGHDPSPCETRYKVRFVPCFEHRAALDQMT
jgi:hypothetical protein